MLKRFFSSLILILLLAVSAVAANKKFVLVIDPGHGGRDAGAVGAFSKEKSINLAVAMAFGKYVETNCPDVKVVYTRRSDKFIELLERANIANKAKADLFVSIHTNAVAKGKSVRGFETYTLGMHRAADNLEVAKRENAVITLENDYQSRYLGFDPNSSESYIIFEYLQDKNMENSVNLAKSIQKNVCSSSSFANKGVHQAGFLVLRETSMPSCLVELGFISNAEEERQLNNSFVQDQLARGLYKAFGEYLQKYSNVRAAALTPTKTETAKAPAVEQQPKVVEAPKEQPKVVEEPKVQPKAEEAPAQKLISPRTEDVKDVAFVPIAAATAATAAAAKSKTTKSETSTAKNTVSEKPKNETPAETKPEVPEQKQQTAEPATKPAEPKNEVKAEPKSNAKETATEVKDKAGPMAKNATASTTKDAPVFKIQILSGSNKLADSSPFFKGLTNIECYTEGGLYKYTYGASTDYNEMNALRKSIAGKFPKAFLVAFKNGTKIPLYEGINEWKQNKNK